MRFFIPTANDLAHAEALYQGVRARFADSRPSDKRIYRLKYQDDGRLKNLAIGDAFHQVQSEPVMIIMEAADCYLVCTANHGTHEGEPVRIPKQAARDVEEFTAVA